MGEEKKTILIAEDEPTLIRALAKKIKGNGYMVIETVNGKECLELSFEKHPDLILLDIVMPKVDGLTVLEKLKDDEWGSKVPVIVLTNLSNVEDVQNATDRGARDYLIKSDWTLEDLMAKIKEKLG